MKRSINILQLGLVIWSFAITLLMCSVSGALFAGAETGADYLFVFASASLACFYAVYTIRTARPEVLFNQEDDNPVKVYRNRDKEFKSNAGLVITRSLFDKLPIPMCAYEFSDDQMEDLVDDIELHLRISRGYNDDDIKDLLSDIKIFPNYEVVFRKRYKEFLDTLEASANIVGMRYYATMKPDELASIRTAVVRRFLDDEREVVVLN